MARKIPKLSNMKNAFVFTLAFLVLIWQKAINANGYLNAFAPFIVLSILTKNKTSVLCRCLLCGILVDFFSSSKMGLWSLNFCLTAYVLFPLRIHFYKDRPQHLAMLTFIFSFISSITYFLLSFLLDRSVLFSGKWFITDCILMSLIDGVYAILCFSFPIWAMERASYKLKSKRKR